MLKAYLKLDLISFLKASEVLGKEVFDIDFISTYIEENIKGINPVLL
jgi:integrase